MPRGALALDVSNSVSGSQSKLGHRSPAASGIRRVAPFRSGKAATARGSRMARLTVRSDAAQVRATRVPMAWPCL